MSEEIRVFVDTNIFIYAIHGDKKAQKLLTHVDVSISEISEIELLLMQ